MTEAEGDVRVKAMQATVRRITAENTWLRHSLMEMEARVANMATQLSQLEARLAAVRKALSTTAAKAKRSSPDRSEPATTGAVQTQPDRSKQR